MARSEIKVREYKDAKDFEREAKKLLAEGWEIKEQSQGATHMNVGRTLLTTACTFGLNMLVPKIGGASYTKGKITVTYVRANP